MQHIYGPRRQYKRTNAAPDDEETRARITLLEYGTRGVFVPNPGAATPTKEKTADLMIEDDGGPPINEVGVIGWIVCRCTHVYVVYFVGFFFKF